jgi:hypothetical protein
MRNTTAIFDFISEMKCFLNSFLTKEEPKVSKFDQLEKTETTNLSQEMQTASLICEERIEETFPL